MDQFDDNEESLFYMIKKAQFYNLLDQGSLIKDRKDFDKSVKSLIKEEKSNKYERKNKSQLSNYSVFKNFELQIDHSKVGDQSHGISTEYYKDNLMFQRSRTPQLKRIEKEDYQSENKVFLENLSLSRHQKLERQRQEKLNEDRSQDKIDQFDKFEKSNQLSQQSQKNQYSQLRDQDKKLRTITFFQEEKKTAFDSEAEYSDQTMSQTFFQSQRLKYKSQLSREDKKKFFFESLKKKQNQLKEKIKRDKNLWKFYYSSKEENDNKGSRASKSVMQNGQKLIVIHLNSNTMIQFLTKLCLIQNLQMFIPSQIILKEDYLTSYISYRYGQEKAKKIVAFIEFKPQTDLASFKNLIEQINDWSQEDILFFCFNFYDEKNKGVLDQRDLSKILLQSNQIQGLEKDYKRMVQHKGFDEKPSYPDLYMNSKKNKITYTKYYQISRNLLNRELTYEGPKASLYQFSFQRIEHDFFAREIFKKKQKEFEKEKRKEILKQTQTIVKELTHEIYHKNEELKISINFFSFKIIFSKNKPYIFYDLVYLLTLIKFPQIQYCINQESINNYLNKLKSNKIKNNQYKVKVPVTTTEKIQFYYSDLNSNKKAYNILKDPELSTMKSKFQKLLLKKDPIIYPK